jgi:competence protein ComEC
MFLPRESFLASMILVGKSGGYNRDIDNMFRQAGLSHILVVSGLHLTMFTDILNYLVYMLPVGLIFVFSINLIFILFFILLIGFTGSLLRASIMVLLHIIGKANHRVYNMTNALLLSSFVILLFNPQTLFVDLGFQLSFLSVLCLVYISPIITDVLTLYFPNEK